MIEIQSPLLIEPYVAHSQLLRHRKRFYHIGASFKASCHQQGSAMNRVTSTALPTVAHQNGFNSTIFNRRANLDLVCITYLCCSQFFSVLCAFFEHFEGLGSWTTE